MKIQSSSSGRSLAKAKKVSQSAVDVLDSQRQRQRPPIRKPMKMLDRKSSKNLLASAKASLRPKSVIEEEEEETQTTTTNVEDEQETDKKKKAPRGNPLKSLMTQRSPSRKSSSRKSGGIPESPGVKMHMSFAEQAMAAVKKRKSKRFTTPRKKKHVTVVEPVVRDPVVLSNNEPPASSAKKTPKIPKRTSSRRLLNKVERPKEKKLQQISISSAQFGLFVVPNVNDGRECVQVVRFLFFCILIITRDFSQ